MTWLLPWLLPSALVLAFMVVCAGSAWARRYVAHIPPIVGPDPVQLGQRRGLVVPLTPREVNAILAGVNVVEVEE